MLALSAEDHHNGVTVSMLALSAEVNHNGVTVSMLALSAEDRHNGEMVRVLARIIGSISRWVNPDNRFGIFCLPIM